MKKTLFVGLIGLFLMAGCQKDVTVIPPQQQQQPNSIIIGRPGVHIDIRPGHHWCNNCGSWVESGHPHHCHHCR